MARDGDNENRLFGLAFGGLGAVVVAVALVPLRDRIDNANLALILVIVVVLAAIVGGRAGGAIAAATATLAFDFFLTQPYLSMRIDSADDIETALILLAVGLMVGEVAVRGRRSRRESERASQAISRVHRVAAQIAQGAPLRQIVVSVMTELGELLELQDCELEVAPFRLPMPRLERQGTLDVTEHEFAGGGFALPDYPVELPVLVRGEEAARFVLTGDPRVAVHLEARVVAVALADQLGSAIAMAAAGELAQIAQDLSGHR